MGQTQCTPPYTLAGFHEQAIYDANCQRVATCPSVSSTADNVNDCEPPPIYDMNLVLELLRSSICANDTAFWVKVSHEHQIKVTVTSVSELRAEFIRHIFSGACVNHHGSGCKSVVDHEKWAQRMGIRVIDSTLEWMEHGSLMVNESTHICGALGVPACAAWMMRALKRKLVDRRQQLLGVMDAASLSLPELLPRLGDSSLAGSLKSSMAAHGLEVLEADTKTEISTKILGHVTRGECANSNNIAPGCERIAKQATPHHDTVHLQVAVLSHVLDNASKKQLCKILDICEIEHSGTDKLKKMRGQLKKFILNIQRGKLREVERESNVIETLRRLDEICTQWPKLIPSAVKEKIVKDFHTATSSAALASFTCACCARESPVGEQIRKSHRDVDLGLLKGPSSNWNDSSFPPPPSPYKSGPLKNKLVDVLGVEIRGDNITLDLCVSCSRCLTKGSVPKHALVNRVYLGAVPNVLGGLTMIEECMIARARAKSWIVKLQEEDTESASPAVQCGLKGHTIIYPQQPDKLVNVLPPPVEDTCDDFDPFHHQVLSAHTR